MKYVVCPKCNEQNAGSVLYCSKCGESLRGAKVVELAENALAPSAGSTASEVTAGTSGGAYGALIGGAVFIFISSSLILGAGKQLPVTTQLLCGLPLLFGVGLVVAGVDMLRRPERYASKPSGGTAQAQARCSVCNRSNEDYLQDLKRKDPNVYIYSTKFIGTCPVCNRSYCVEHAAFDGDIDHEVCPTHRAKLV